MLQKSLMRQIARHKNIKKRLRGESIRREKKNYERGKIYDYEGIKQKVL